MIIKIFCFAFRLEINEFLGRQICETNEEAISFINKVNNNYKEGNSFYWAITLTETNTLVGTICLFDFSTENDSCEIGYELMKNFKDKV